VKANEYLSAIEREQLKALPVAVNVTRECWRFVDGDQERRVSKSSEARCAGAPDGPTDERLRRS
jgi:hypothetical protein